MHELMFYSDPESGEISITERACVHSYTQPEGALAEKDIPNMDKSSSYR